MQSDANIKMMDRLQVDERAIVIQLNGRPELKQYLLIHGFTVGTVFVMNYSPTYSGLINLTVGGKMISLRNNDFQKMDWTRI